MKRFISYIFAILLVGLLGISSAMAAAPTVQARYVTVSNVGYDATNLGTASAAWINGNGNGRIVVLKYANGGGAGDWSDFEGGLLADLQTNDDFSSVADANGNLANAVLDNDNVLTSNGTDFVIVDILAGSTRTSSLSQLAATTTYEVHVYELNKVSSDTADFNITEPVMNPRTFTSATATTYDTPTATVLGPNVTLSWASSMGDAMGWILVINNADHTPVAQYDFIDIGVLDTGTPEVFVATLDPGTYYARIRSFSGTSFGPWRQTAASFTVAEVTPPKFATGLTTNLDFADNAYTVDVTFDKEVTSNSTGSAADLELADFAIANFAANTGNTVTPTITAATEVGTDALDKMVYRLTITFNGRTTGDETFDIVAADNYSIFGRNGVPMDDSYGAFGYDDQATSVNAYAATVLLNNAVAYRTIANALDNIVAGDNTIKLTDGITYSPGYVSQTSLGGKNITIIDDGGEGTNAVVNAAFWFKGGIIDINGITIQCPDTSTYAAINLGTSGTHNVTIQNCILSTNDVGGSIIKHNTFDNTSTLSILNNTFDMTGAAYGINTVGNGESDNVKPVLYTIQGNTFSNIAAAAKAINIKANGNAASTAGTISIGTTAGNTFNGAGDAIYFEKVGTNTMGISAINIQNNIFSNTGYAINFQAATNFTSVLPNIDLFAEGEPGTYNSFGENSTGFASGFFHDGTGGTIDLGNEVYDERVFTNATFLASGPVLVSTDAIADINDEAFATINAGYNALGNVEGTDFNHLILMDEMTHDLTLGLLTVDHDFTHTIMGKSPFAVPIINGKFDITGTAGNTVTVDALSFEAALAMQIKAVPATSTITIQNCAFNLADYSTGIVVSSDVGNVSAPVAVVGNLNITRNMFSHNVNGVANLRATAISFPNNQITGNVLLDNNTFLFNTGGNASFPSTGIFFSSTNTLGVSDGNITIIGNFFQAPNIEGTEEAPDEYNGIGTAILFSDDATYTETYNLSTATINIFNGNDFQNDGYAIAFEEYEGELLGTLPTSIDLWDAAGEEGSQGNTAGSSAITGDKIYGAAWYTLTGSDAVTTTNSKLYPSIQACIAADFAGVVSVGRGLYDESVTTYNTVGVADYALTGFAGWAGVDDDCDLVAGNTLTLTKNVTVDTEDGTFEAPTVVLANDAAKLDDAHTLVQENGTIVIPTTITIAGNTTISKDGLTITGDDNVEPALGGTYTGEMTASGDRLQLSYLTIGDDFTLAPEDGKSADRTSIHHNVFSLPIVFNDGETYALEDDISIKNNTFNLATVDGGNSGIQVRGQFANSLNIEDNVFNMSGNTTDGVTPQSGYDAAIYAYVGTSNAIHQDEGDDEQGILLIRGNTFANLEANTNPNNAAIVFQNAASFSSFEDYRVYNNAFNNYGYSIYKVADANFCTNQTEVNVVDGAELNPNTFGVNLNGYNAGNSVHTTSGIYGYYYSPLPLSSTTDVITPDCDKPLAVQVGTVVATVYADPTHTANTGTAADYYNSYNTHVQVVVPLPVDPSLVNGTIQIQIAKNDGSLNWTNVGTSGLATITAYNTTQTLYLTDTDLLATEEFAEDATKIQFRAIVTDMAGNTADVVGDPSLDDLVRDETAPEIVMTNPAQSSIINLSPQIQGTYTETGSGLKGIDYSLIRSTNNTLGNYLNYYNKINDSWTSEEVIWNNMENIDAPGTGQWNDNFEPVLTENYYQWKVRATDKAGNISVVGNLGSDTYRAFRIDQTPPTIVSVTKIDDTQLLVTYSEEVQSSGAQLLTNYALTTTTATTYTLASAVRGTDVNSNKVTLTLNQSIAGFVACDWISVTAINIKDIAQNTIVANGTTNTARYQQPDVIDPYVESVFRHSVNADGVGAPGDGNSYLTNASTVTYTVTFSERVGHRNNAQTLHQGAPNGQDQLPTGPLTALLATDFQVIGEGAGTITGVENVSNGDIAFRVTVTVVAENDGDNLSVAPSENNLIWDYGCGTTGTNWLDQTNHFPYTVMYYKSDRKAPVVTPVSIASDNANTSFAKNGDEVTVYFTSSEPIDIANSTATIMGQTATISNVNGLAYKATFTIPVNEATITQGLVGFSVTAKDPAGNTATAVTATTGDPASSVTYDRTKPELQATTGVTVNKTMVNEGEVGLQKFIVTAIFDEAMKVSVYPTIVFAGNPIEGGTFTLNGPATGWTTAYTYSWVYDVADLNVNMDDIDITISAAQDLAGNMMLEDATYTNLFSIDMVAPTAIVELSSSNSTTNPNGYLINHETTTLTAKVTFSEPMDGIATPVFSFSQVIQDRLTPVAAGVWSGNNTIYTITYNVSNTTPIPDANNYTLSVGGAQDVAGNTMTQVDVANIKADQVVPVITWRDAYQSTTGVNPVDRTDRWVKNGDHVYYEYTASEVLGGYTDLYFNNNPVYGGQDMFQPFEDGTTVYGFYGIVSDLNYPTDGTMTHKITAKDNAGNVSNTLSGSSINHDGGVAVVVDRTAPYITSITRNPVTTGANFLTTDESVSFKVRFSETVTDFTTANAGTQIAINAVDINAAGFGVTVSELVQDVAGDYYTVTVNNILTGDGTVGITVTGVHDLATNTMVATNPSTTVTNVSQLFTIDNTAPTVTGVVLNCLNQPTTGSIANRKATVTLSEPIYSTADGSGPIVASSTTPTDMLLTITDQIGATVNTWALSSGAAGTTTLVFDLTWSSGTIYGSEKVRADFQTNQVYDLAGNVAAVVGTNNATNNATTNRALAISTHPVDVTICGGTNAVFSASAEGDGNTQYTWQVGGVNPETQMLEWIDVADIPVEAGIDYVISLGGSTITVTSVPQIFDGLQFRYKVANNCDTIYSNVATIYVTPAPVVSTEAQYKSVCENAVTTSFTVASNVDALQGTTYEWQYRTAFGDPDLWEPVSNGNPANAVYTDAATATLVISGNIAADGDYGYRLKVTNSCAQSTTSPTCSLRVTALPLADRNVTTGGQVCYNSAGTVTITNPELGVLYTLMNGETVVDGPDFNYTEDPIIFTTGALTANTTYSIKAQRINETDEELIISTCDVTLTTTPTIAVEATPVAGSLAKVQDVAKVCSGTSVSATLTAGSGGLADLAQYRTSANGGQTWSVDWTTYTPGNAISTAGLTNVEIRLFRTAAVCSTAIGNTVSWTVEATPVAGTVITEVGTWNEDLTAYEVCEGTEVFAAHNPNSGGNDDDDFYYQTSTDGGTIWSDPVDYSQVPPPGHQEQNPSDISTTGLTNVRFTNTRNADVCTADSETLMFVVNPNPTNFALSVPNNGRYCADGNGLIISQNGSQLNVNYQLQVNNAGWNNVGSAVAGTGSGFTFPVQLAGQYQVIATAANTATNCSTVMNSASSITIEAVALPIAQVSPLGNQNICEGSAFTTGLSAAEIGVTYGLYWNTNTLVGTAITAASTDAFSFPEVASALAGTYNIKATRNGMCPVTMTNYVTVNELPTADAGTYSVVCNDATSLQLDATITNNVSNPNWTVVNGTGTFNDGTLVDPIYTFSPADKTAGTVTLRITVDNQGCATVYDDVVITIAPKLTPTVAITADPGSAVCFGNSVTFTATPANTNVSYGGTVSYTWYKNNNLVANETASTYTLSNVSTNDIVRSEITVTSPVCLTSATAVSNNITMTVTPLPNPSVLALPTACQNGTSVYSTQVGYTDYEWVIPGVLNTDYQITAGATNTYTVTVKWLTAGVKRVTANYKNNGCFAANPASTQTTVNPIPVLTITAPAEVCQPNTVDLTASAIVAGTLYQTSYAYYPTLLDAQNSTNALANASAIAVSGTYYIKAINACGYDVEAVTVVVNTRPVLGVVAQPTAVCYGSTVNLETAVIIDGASTVGTYTYYSDADLNNVVSTPTAVAAGIYYAVKTVTATGCVSLKVPLTATVRAEVVPTISGATTIAAYEELTLTTEVGMTGYNWSVGNATIVSGQGTSTIKLKWAAGDVGQNKNITVTYTNGNLCSGTSANHTVNITAGCQAIVISTQPTATQTVCAGSNATLTVATSAGSNIAYQWYMVGTPNVAVSGATSATLNVTNIQANAQYYVTLTNTCSNITSNTATINVTQLVTPSVTIALTAGTNPACTGTSLTFTATPVNGGTPTYVWKKNNVTIDGQTAATFTSNGLVNADAISVVMTSTITCVVSQTATSNSIVVNANATPNLVITTPAAVCAPATVDLTAPAVTENSTDLVANNLSYWEDEECTIAYTSPSAVTASGTYYIKATNNTNCYDVQPVVVRIDDAPPAQPSAITGLASVSRGDAAVAYSVTNLANTTYTWTYSGLGATFTGNGTNAVTVAFDQTATTGTLTVTPSNACGDGTAQTMNITVLSAEPTAKATMRLYSPNPGAIRIIIPAANTVDNGNRRLVTFSHSNVEVSSGLPVDGTAYTASTIFGYGSVLYSTAPNTSVYKVYVVADLLAKSTPDTLFISNLASRQFYNVAIYDYNTADPTLATNTSATNNYNTALDAKVTSTSSATSNHQTLRTMRKEIPAGQEQFIAESFEVRPVAPNPAKDEIYFSIDAIDDNDFVVELFSSNGERVFSQTNYLTKGSHSMGIPLSTKKGHVAAGVYTLKVTSNGESLDQQVVVMP